MDLATDFEDTVITQLGLVLSQVRYARRTLEEIERSSARFAGIVLSGNPGSPAGGFGAPPLNGGALRVFVENLEDLVAPPLGFFESLLGGIGSFLGGALTSAVSGFLAGFTLPDLVIRLEKIVSGVTRILDLIGLRGASEQSSGKDAKGKEAKPASGPEFPLLDFIDKLKDLFSFAVRGPEAGNKGPPGADASNGWMTTIGAVNRLLDSLSVVSRSLTGLLPSILGFVEYLISRLPTLQRAILDVVAFLLKNAFLLRASILGMLGETLLVLGNLGSSVLDILSRTVLGMLNSASTLIDKVLGMIELVLPPLAAGLQRAVDGVLDWLSVRLDSLLRSIGTSVVGQGALHLIDILPGLLPALIVFRHGPGAVSEELLKGLKALGPLKFSFAEATKQSNVHAPTGSPVDPAATLRESLRTAHDGVQLGVGEILILAQELVQQGLDGAAKLKKRGEDFVDQDIPLSQKRLGERLTKLGARTAEVNQLLVPVVSVSAAISPIAQAYEDWMVGGGLKSLIQDVTKYLQLNPQLPQAVQKLASEAAPPRAIIEIGEVVIELNPPARAATPPIESNAAPRSVTPRNANIHDVLELWQELEERGFHLGTGALLSRLPF